MTERFELLERIGRGGMGVVWKARDTESGEIVTLKLMHDMFQDDEDFVARFSREVELTRRIDSPYVVRTLGFGLREGRPFMSMEYVEGPSLRDRIKAKPLTWPELKPVAREIALGLGAAHLAGVVHRDIKPSNILLTGDGHAKIADFGISTAADMTRLTGSQTMLGSPAYMAPESTRDHHGDLYSLGCVLFEALTGRQVFEGESITDLVRAHISQPPPVDLLPSEARPLVAWLLRKDPLERPADASALVAALDGGRIPASPVAVPVVPAAKPRKRRAFAAAVAGIAALLTLGVAGATFVAMGGGDDDQQPASASGDVPATTPATDTPASSTNSPRISTVTPMPGESPTVVLPGSPTAAATDAGVANVAGSPSPTPTSTATATRTPTSQPGIVSSTPSYTPTPSSTPTPTPTVTPTATPTTTPTLTPTPSSSSEQPSSLPAPTGLYHCARLESTWCVGWQWVSSAQSYEVYLNGVFYSALSSSTTRLSISGLIQGTTYQLYLISVNGSGRSAPSTTIEYSVPSQGCGCPGRPSPTP